MKRWSSAEPFTSLVSSTVPLTFTRLGNGGACKAALHLPVELSNVSKRSVSFEYVTEAFPQPSLEHLCPFLHLGLKSEISVWLASLFLLEFHHCPLVSPR